MVIYPNRRGLEAVVKNLMAEKEAKEKDKEGMKEKDEVAVDKSEDTAAWALKLKVNTLMERDVAMKKAMEERDVAMKKALEKRDIIMKKEIEELKALYMGARLSC
ncbi:hypothetical protein M501DRAFT_1000219 [Patellaria atrata CBS 101060]|uniref:Uncharacterized protein n=1 Tax=Patellaria atrata CBS 101060 TaxID=1346257 RepID=A0A9P4S1S7_9PEZI|nr:hypothetical protein M501DRAFT_1000219 [Patellaria atrata CBS 101060]